MSARAQAPAWQTAEALVPLSGFGLSTVSAVATDAGGNAYVAGSFQGTINIGSTALSSAGGTDIFVAKWERASRRFVWAQRAGGSSYDFASAVAVAGSSIYISGAIASTSSFGSLVLNGLAPAGYADGFVAKLTDAGASSSFVWVQLAGGDARALAATTAGVYVAGGFGTVNNTPALQTAAFGSTALTSAGATDIFVAKLTDNGTSSSFAWAQRAGGTGSDGASAVALGGNGSVYVAGDFTSATAGFGSVSLANASSGGFYSDAYVAKLTDAGASSSFVWAQRAGGTGSDGASAVAVNGTSIYLAGTMAGTADFGSATLTSAGDADVFVAKLTDAGASSSFAWAQRAGGTGSDGASALAIGSGGELYVAGRIAGAAVFGSTALTSAGGTDVVVAKLTDNGATGSFVWAQRAGGAGSDGASALAVSGPSIYVGGSFSPPASFGAHVLAAGISFPGFLASIDATVLAVKSPIEMGIAVFPNPTRGTATIQFSSIPGATTAIITLLDALGRPVRSTTVPMPAAGLRHELDLTGLPAGLYGLRIAAGAATATHRLVVE